MKRFLQTVASLGSQERRVHLGGSVALSAHLRLLAVAFFPHVTRLSSCNLLFWIISSPL
jgi:hypothetical protein